MIKILFVSTGLQTGGAEKMLLKILQTIDRTRFDPHVVSLIDEGTLGHEIRKLNVPLACLRMNTAWGALTAPWRLANLIRTGRYALVQGWMYHGNLLAWLASLLAFRKNALCFGVRHTAYDLAREKRGTRLVIRANAFLSRFAQSCLFNSETSLTVHRQLGFRSPSMAVIPNGFDLKAYWPSSDGVPELRAELNLANAPVVGLIARFDPAKDHANFLSAAGKVHRLMPEVKFLMAGRGVTRNNQQLMGWIAGNGLSGAVQLLGERQDVSVLNNLFDVACLSSHMEAFPNVIGEAMACGTPCVATDVGDCRSIIGATGRVVQPENSEALAEALVEMLKLPADERKVMGVVACEKMNAEFDIVSVVKKYMAHYECIVLAAAI